jgi:hypothetical protein
MNTEAQKKILSIFENPKWDGSLIVSPDWDGIMSAAIVCSHYERASLIGFYDGGELRISSSTTESVDNIVSKLERSIWLDVDIFDSRFVSIGQHLISPTANSCQRVGGYSRHPLSHNPHDLIGRGWDYPLPPQQCLGVTQKGEPCRKKGYPGNFCFQHGGEVKPANYDSETKNNRGFTTKFCYATAQIILCALGLPEGVNFDSKLRDCIAHADSVAVTCSRYAGNSLMWHREYFSSSIYTSDVAGPNAPWISQREAVARLTDLVIELNDICILETSTANPSQNESQIPHLAVFTEGFSGKQVQRISDRWVVGTLDLSNLSDAVNQVTGLDLRGFGMCSRVFSGTRRKIDKKSIRGDGLPWSEIGFDRWLNENQVFSLAFTGYETLRYTTNMQL